jgi:hypothetical protein
LMCLDNELISVYVHKKLSFGYRFSGHTIYTAGQFLSNEHFFCLLNPDYAVDTYCGLKNLAATLVSRFCFSTYLQICLRRKIAPTSRFAEVFQPS